MTVIFFFFFFFLFIILFYSYVPASLFFFNFYLFIILFLNVFVLCVLYVFARSLSNSTPTQLSSFLYFLTYYLFLLLAILFLSFSNFFFFNQSSSLLIHLLRVFNYVYFHSLPNLTLTRLYSFSSWTSIYLSSFLLIRLCCVLLSILSFIILFYSHAALGTLASVYLHSCH